LSHRPTRNTALPKHKQKNGVKAVFTNVQSIKKRIPGSQAYRGAKPGGNKKKKQHREKTWTALTPQAPTRGHDEPTTAPPSDADRRVQKKDGTGGRTPASDRWNGLGWNQRSMPNPAYQTRGDPWYPVCLQRKENITSEVVCREFASNKRGKTSKKGEKKGKP